MTDIQILENCFSLFNEYLFGNELPLCIVTLQRSKKSRGYFHASIFENRADEKETCHEIAMNPAHFNRSIKEILSTLVHEMCHLWQQEFGEKKSLKSYHNKEWAEKMESIGLMASSDGTESGKKTGQNMTHYIIDGGRFEGLFDHKTFRDIDIKWQSRVPVQGIKNKSAKTSKNKFTCPNCQQNAWAKETAKIICGDCDEEMELSL